MTNIKFALAVGLAATALALILTNAIAGVMVLQAGLAPVFGIGAIALAIAAFVLSLNQKLSLRDKPRRWLWPRPWQKE